MMNKNNFEAELFTLDSEELRFIQSKHFKTKLQFAVMLKFFRLENRFPNNEEIISIELIQSISNQVDNGSKLIANVDWENRTSERFRQEIRDFFGYRKATIVDSEKLNAWLIENVLPLSPTIPQCCEKAVQFFHENKLESFTPRELERYVRSASHKFEKQFFSNVFTQLSDDTTKLFDSLLSNDVDEVDGEKIDDILDIKLRHLKTDVAGAKLKNVESEINKLNRIRQIPLPKNLFDTLSRKLLQKYYTRIMAELPSNINDHEPEVRYATMTVFCYVRSQLMTDNLADVLIQLIHKMKTTAESSLTKEILAEVKCVNGKFDILYTLSSTAAAQPDGIIQQVIYPKVSQETLQNLASELHSKGKWYQTKVKTKIRSLYSHAHRKVLLTLLSTFVFRTNNPEFKALLNAIEFIKQQKDFDNKYYLDAEMVPLKGVIPNEWVSMVVSEKSGSDDCKVDKMNYEIAVLEELRKQLRCKSIWIEGAYRFRNPDEDTPKDFDTRRNYYYEMLNLPLDADDYINSLKEMLDQQLQLLNDSIQHNNKVKILDQDGGKIKLSPSNPQAEPTHLRSLHREINRRWSTINLIDILKEADLRIGFTKQFHTVGSREAIDKDELQKRLLLCIYAIGSNTGLKRISAANADASDADLRYIKRRFIQIPTVRAAIVDVVNEILAVRDTRIWGEATTGVACDSTQVSSWDQNLMTEWHTRYRGRGVMIYWHVDKNAACIYSQLKTCSSSEVGAMMQGILRHSTAMDLQKGYTDTHGQSAIGFGFSHLLHFDLLPRLKNLNKQKLYFSSVKHKNNYPNLSPILKEAINWDIIKENYDEVVKYVAALKTGTADADVIIKRFSKDNYNHPVYKALSEIGHAVKTIFLCRYLSSEELRIEIHESLNVVERLNGIMGFIFYGKLGEISTNKKDDQELAVVSLHLLQVCMVYINTLIIQEVLSDPKWLNKLMPEDMRALSPLIHSHINPYGLFPLDLAHRLVIEPLKQAVDGENQSKIAGYKEAV
jgi:TnpA family transposase